MNPKYRLAIFMVAVVWGILFPAACGMVAGPDWYWVGAIVGLVILAFVLVLAAIDED